MTLSVPANRELRGIPVARAIEERLAAQVATFPRPPRLMILLVGNNPASATYVRKKIDAAARCGILAEVRSYDDTVTQEHMEADLLALTQDPEVTGYIVQLPLPKHLDLQALVQRMDPRKDVDGFTAANAGGLFLGGAPTYLPPATARGVLELLLAYTIPLAGKHAVIVGRSNLVGKPLAMELLAQDATITLCHSKTADLSHHTRQADILISAVGSMHLITPDMVRPGAVLVDVGFHKTSEGLFGDIHPDANARASAFAPVPGGVGAVTVASLLANVVHAYALLHPSL